MKRLFNLAIIHLITCLLLTGCDKSETSISDIPGEEQEKPIIPIDPDKGINLYGAVYDETGKGIANVVVSDGYSCTETDSKGVYQLERNIRSKYVFISAPSGYELPTQKDKGFGSYQLIYAPSRPTTPSPQPHRADFPLKTLSTKDTKFTLVAMGDPQPDNDTHVERFRNETINDLQKHLSSVQNQKVALALGDILGKGDAARISLMKKHMGASDIPFFVTIGNHDKSSLDYTGEIFDNVFGPRWYSFNRGDAHFICLDDIIFTTPGESEYQGGFSDEQIDWLEKDLSYVNKDKLLIVYYHIPLRNTSSYKNYDRFMSLINQYPNHMQLCGHTHYYQAMTNKYGYTEQILGGACGYFWRSNSNSDGTPNGYMVYTINSNKVIDSYFKATGREKDFQIRLYRGDARFTGNFASYGYNLGTDVVVANVFAAGLNGTWKVELFEDGVLSGEMQPMNASYGDQWIRGYHIGVKNYSTGSALCNCYHQYQYQLKNPAATVSVKATDAFGNVYTQDRFTESNDYTETAL